jgi:NAD dependent epimerase/dehydratase
MANKILITGATGFIGSHLSELCVRSGFQVVAYDRYNSNNDWGWLEYSELKDELDVVLGDIRDYDSVYRAMDGCDTVLHLAALIGIPYSYVSPQAYIRTNIDGTYNILESARNQSTENVLVTSTSETYGTAQYTPIDEDHPLVGQSPYSASKIGADQMAVSYYRSFDLPVKIVRPFNTYGPRQSSRAIIPTIISQILFGNDEILLGNLSPTRDLTFVKDTASGFLEILKTDGLYGEFTNIGMNAEISIGDLAQKIADLMGSEIKIQQEKQRLRPGKSEVDQLLASNKKILTQTNWKPGYTLDQGLLETVEWMRSHLSMYKPDHYNV